MTKPVLSSIQDVKVGMIFANFDWDGPCTVVVIKIESGYIFVSRLDPANQYDNIASLGDSQFGDERELLLESTLIGGMYE